MDVTREGHKSCIQVEQSNTQIARLRELRCLFLVSVNPATFHPPNQVFNNILYRILVPFLVYAHSIHHNILIKLFKNQ